MVTFTVYIYYLFTVIDQRVTFTVVSRCKCFSGFNTAPGFDSHKSCRHSMACSHYFERFIYLYIQTESAIRCAFNPLFDLVQGQVTQLFFLAITQHNCWSEPACPQIIPTHTLLCLYQGPLISFGVSKSTLLLVCFQHLQSLEENETERGGVKAPAAVSFPYNEVA